MRSDCSFCGPSALRSAAEAGIRPSQVIPGRRVKGGGVMARCLCCGRIWESHAAWTKPKACMKRKCPMCRRMIELNADLRFITHPWMVGASRPCPKSGEIHEGAQRDREWARKVVEGS